MTVDCTREHVPRLMVQQQQQPKQEIGPADAFCVTCLQFYDLSCIVFEVSSQLYSNGLLKKASNGEKRC